MSCRQIKSFFLPTIILGLSACGGGSDPATDPVTDTVETPKVVEISGQFQKGPFIAGTEITIQELNTDLSPTGRSFQTQTTSNFGDYMLPVNLTSSIVEISANGYYFNEVTGALSDSTLRLSAIADTSKGTEININILTHLSKKRIQALISEGSYFANAKAQAEEEVGSLFSFYDINTSPSNFDQMDISQTGSGNAFLLLVSSIFQKAKNSSADLSEYIENVSQDLSDNGIVDDNTLIDTLSTTQSVIDLNVIRTNLEEKYTSLGRPTIFPNFESLLNRPPVAIASTDDSAVVGSPVYFDGSGSYDFDSDEISYNWVLLSSPVGSTAVVRP